MYKIILVIINVIIFLLVLLSSAIGQKTVTLEDVLQKVNEKSYSVQLAKTQVEIAQTKVQLLHSELRPSLGLDLLVPNYQKRSTQVVQPDGTVSFLNVSQNNSSVNLYATQHIGLTGGQLFVESDLQRFDDFTRESWQYNGVPIRFGFKQPIFGFNPWKWKKKILPFEEKEATLNYSYAVENAQWRATDLYFDILIAQVNKEIAGTNKSVNETLLEITKERFKLGKASKDQQLQLEMGFKNATLDEYFSDKALRQAISNLYTFLGTSDIPTNIIYELPKEIEDAILDVELLVKRGIQTHPKLLSYQRNLLEGERYQARVKSEYGIKADLFMGFGFSKAGSRVEEIYRDPGNEQQVRLSVSVPIIDWGRKKEAMKIASLQRKQTETSLTQEAIVLENNIRSKVSQFIFLKREIELLKDIKNIAEERFEISRQRYTLGNISITDLSIAQNEKDQASRGYVLALRNYWSIYYELRTLTGGAI